MHRAELPLYIYSQLIADAMGMWQHYTKLNGKSIFLRDTMEHKERRPQ